MAQCQASTSNRNSFLQTPVVIALILAPTLEALQWLIPGRLPDLRDLGLNFGGVGLAAIWLTVRRNPRNGKDWAMPGIAIILAIGCLGTSQILGRPRHHLPITIDLRSGDPHHGFRIDSYPSPNGTKPNISWSENGLAIEIPAEASVSIHQPLRLESNYQIELAIDATSTSGCELGIRVDGDHGDRWTSSAVLDQKASPVVVEIAPRRPVGRVDNLVVFTVSSPEPKKLILREFRLTESKPQSKAP